MGLVNYLAQHEGVSIVFQIIETNFPPLLVLVDRFGDSSLPEAADAFLDSLKKYEATQPDSIIDIAKYRHRFLVEKPFLPVLMDLLKELGLTDIEGIDAPAFVKALVEYREGKS